MLLIGAAARRRGRARSRPRLQYKRRIARLPLQFSARSFQPSRFQDRVVVLHGQREVCRRPRVRLPAHVFPPGRAARRGHDSRGPSKICIWRTRRSAIFPAASSIIPNGSIAPVPASPASSQESGRIWNGNWQSRVDRRAADSSTSSPAEWTLHLTLDSQKPPVIHGEQGISRKGAAPGEASHYISLTRLAATGTIELGGQTYSGRRHGLDGPRILHQSTGAGTGRVGLAQRAARRSDGADAVPPATQGWLDRSVFRGHVRRSQRAARGIFPRANSRWRRSAEQWTSPATGAAYPIRWQVSVPSLNLNLEISTRLPQQEMTASGPASPNYWEGAIEITGTRGGALVTGVGYLEMTGYDRPIRLGQ